MKRFSKNLLIAASIAGVTFATYETTEAGLFRKKSPVRSAVARFKENRSEAREVRQENVRRIFSSRTVRTSRQPSEVSTQERRRVFAIFRRSSETGTGTSAFARAKTKQVKVYEPKADINHAVLASSNRSSNRVVVDISKQKAYLLTSTGKVAIESPVSTARTGKYTPRGTFYVTERVPVGKISTIYGVGMPYWMRLNSSVYGMHAGYLPGYPASAGCIRFPNEAAHAIFNHTKSGTPVSIYSSWSGS